MKRASFAGIILGLCTLCAICSDVYAQEAEVDADGNPIEKKEEGPSTLKTLGSIGLAILGLGIVAIPAAKTFSSNLSYAQARLNLTNFLRTNPYQAEQMAKRMDGTFAEAIAAALKMGAMAGSRDPAIVTTSTAPIYDATGQGLVTKIGTDVTKAKMGLMAAIGGAGLGIAGGSLIAIPIILALLTIAAFLRLLWFKSELASTIIRARAEVLPEVNAAICSGRYVGVQMPGA